MRTPRLARHVITASLALALSVLAPGARADVVTDWNETAVIAMAAAGLNGLQQSRTLAIVHAAIYDAVNSIDRRHSPYVADVTTPAGASIEAAAASAAYTLLTSLFWLQTPIFDVALENLLASIPEGQSRSDGIAVGREAARAVLAVRASDGATASVAYTARTGPGLYQLTPPVNAPPLMPHWGQVRPFTLSNAGQFAVKGPAPYASAEFARDFDEVKRLGAKTSSARSKDQTDAARFWVISGVVTDNSAARQVALKKGTSVAENARIFALLNLAGGDVYIACWEAKYRLHHWRPITAIRNAASTGNPALVGDPTWEPLLVTPAHPEYPAGHTCYAGATERVLQEGFGDDNSFTLTFPAMKMTRSYRSFSQMGKEVIDARVWGGVHYRTTDEHGFDLGRRIADHVLQTTLRPRP